MKNSIWLTFIAGMATGMGNGSVFSLAFMLALGREPFSEAGLWGTDAYWPLTYMGLTNFIMIVFGLAFVWILGHSLKLHAVIEGQKA